jgi:hypothetical protein
MQESKSWKSQVALFVFFFGAIVGAGAYRTMQFDAAAANQAAVGPASSPATDGEPPSNEITDYTQLD